MTLTRDCLQGPQESHIGLINVLNVINKKVKRRNKMQKLDMSSYGVEELDVNEMRNLDGGVILTIVSIVSVLAFGVMKTVAAGGLVGGGVIGVIESIITGISGIIIA